MVVTGVVVLAHGSRGERGKGEVEAVLKRVAIGLGPLLAPGVKVIGAALQFNQPSLEEAAALLSAKGVDRIVIAPYFLFPGRHITEHIPQIVEKLQRDYPGISFLLTDNLGLNGAFIGLMAKRIKEAAPDLTPYVQRSLSRSIEQESMKIVEGLLHPLPGMSGEELTVLKRIIHASGDSELYPLVKFSQSAISEGILAISRGAPIFTDVRMVMAGVDSHLAEAFGCSISCALDETAVAELAEKRNITRTAAAIAHLRTRLNDAIVAIGNAPTALLALINLIDEGISPALVVGMPVGFVQAEESKEELMKRDIPYITVMGTRGGSAMAAATVNSLLRIAADKYGCNSLNQEKEESQSAERKGSPT